jgi:hypothetical protein
MSAINKIHKIDNIELSKKIPSESPQRFKDF